MSFDVEHQVPTQGYGQYLSTTCWYPSFRMLHAWKGDREAGAGHAVVIVGHKARPGVFKVHNPCNRFEPGMVELEWLKGDALRKWVIKERCALQAWP